jgi:predicted nucleic acid-binding protein
VTTTVVLDASVIIKWLLRDPDREPATAQATALMKDVITGRRPVLQPFHWLAEVAAVLCRLAPATAGQDALRLQALRLPEASEPVMLRRACDLAIERETHVFDALYHAVALETRGVLVTADQSYLRAARDLGAIVALEGWSDPD